MHIEFWGAAREVTGSMHLVDTGRSRVLLDCGLFQGHRKNAFERNRNLPFDAAGVDAVVLSHAHLDHAGILDGNSPVPIYGEQVEIRAAVRRADAVREGGDVERWFLVHGEPDAQVGLKEGLVARGVSGVENPERGHKAAI
jgi:glyoxylase-like metal-dependent hydrolase (beta-lactamase superfamily II)